MSEHTAPCAGGSPSVQQRGIMFLTSSDIARRGRLAGLSTAVVLAGAMALCALPALARPIAAETAIRISKTGADSDAARDTVDPYVAYNPHLSEYLVAWSADGLTNDDEFEIFARRIGPSGVLLGDPIRVSTTGADGDPSRGTFSPAVAYNPVTREYLVTWRADGLATDEEFEIFAQRVSATGRPLGGNFRVSTTGSDGDASRDAFPPSVTANSDNGEFLVTWSADPLAADEDFEIFAQRIDARGTLVGSAVRVSFTGPEGDPARQARQAGVAYNPLSREYLITWLGDALAVDNENEIFAQRLSSAGVLQGNNFRVSTTGTDGDANRDAFPPSITLNADKGEYLVIWSADALAIDDDYEIFAQRIGRRGNPVGSAIRVSFTGNEGDSARQARQANAAYNANRGEYLITWLADGLAVDDENEVFAQRVSASGKLRGKNVQVSTTGVAGDASRDADGFPPGVVYNRWTGDYFVTWTSDALATDDEFEVFAKRFRRPR